MSARYGERSARSNIKMSVNNVKSSACHIQRFAREARAIEKREERRGRYAREKLVAWKSPLGPGELIRSASEEKRTAYCEKGPLEQKCLPGTNVKNACQYMVNLCRIIIILSRLVLSKIGGTVQPDKN